MIVYVVMAVDNDNNVRIYDIFSKEEDAKAIAEKLRGCWVDKYVVK
jgi:hypothetical protein